MRESKHSIQQAGVIKQAEDIVQTAVLLGEGCSGDASHTAVGKRQTITQTSQENHRDKQPNRQPAVNSSCALAKDFLDGTHDTLVQFSKAASRHTRGLITLWLWVVLTVLSNLHVSKNMSGFVKLEHIDIKRKTLCWREKACSYQ